MKPKVFYFFPLQKSRIRQCDGGCDGGCDGDGALEECCDGNCIAPHGTGCNGDGAVPNETGSCNGDCATLASLLNQCDGCDADGACAENNRGLKWQSRASESVLLGRTLVSSPNLLLQTIDSSYAALWSSDGKIPFAILNQPALEILSFFSQPRDPAEWTYTDGISYEDAQMAIAELYGLGLLMDASFASRPSPNAGVKPTLEVWLYLTRACNLSCAHCFVNKDPRRMSLETGLAAVERLFELAQKGAHPGVKIKYAGGEPTMNWELIPALHERAKKLSRQTGLRLTEALITNATLLSPERLRFLKEQNIRLSVSLDGFGDGHNAQRPSKNGSPTFERVLNAVVQACQLGLSPYLTMTLTRLNLREAPQAVRFALENRLMMNLNFYRPRALGDPLAAENQALEKALRKCLKVVEENPPDYNFLDGLIDRSHFGVPHEYACGAGRSYFTVDADGGVLPCHMLAGYDQPGKPLSGLEALRFEDFSNPSVDQRSGCRTCEWRYWCAGGCPVFTANMSGAADLPSPYCGVYKAVYPEVVRLRAWQLLNLVKEPA